MKTASVISNIISFIASVGIGIANTMSVIASTFPVIGSAAKQSANCLDCFVVPPTNDKFFKLLKINHIKFNI